MPGVLPLETPPTSADAARDLLPGVRIAAREKYGRVRMAFIAPFLPILIQLIAHFLIPWLHRWLSSRGPTSPQMFALARSWEESRPYEVALGMMRAAEGETGE